MKLNIALKKTDLILLAAVLIVAGLAFIAPFFFGGGKDGGALSLEAVITVNGETVAVLPLGEDSTYEIKTGLGFNTVSVTDGKAKIAEADCPGELCVKQGEISRGGQTIVCLPHRVLIEIKGASGEDFDVDAVSR